MLGIAKMQEYKCIFWNLWLGLDPDMFFHPRFFQHYCHTHNSDRLQCFSCLFKGNDNEMDGQWTSFYMICPEFHGIPGRSWDLQDYPANTVRGRICLGLRLDWDKVWDLFKSICQHLNWEQDPGQVFSKETSDIYIKVKLLAHETNEKIPQSCTVMR